MNYENIRLSCEGAVCTLVLNRPQAMNALNEALILEMGQALESIEREPDIRVLVLTGNEKVFAAGGDIKKMLGCNPQEARDYVIPIHRVFNRLARLRIPTIAAVSGFALGGGVELCLTCDFRMAADNARFGFPEISLGIFPGAGGTQRLTRLVGLSRAKELMFTGKTITAGQALDMGLVNQVEAVDELMPAVMEFAGQLASKPPLALARLKESIHNALDMDLQSGLAAEIDKICDLFSTTDQKEGMQAFLEKRKPIFRGK